MTATTVSGVIGGPVSGGLLALDGTFGLSGWKWLFLAEGVPAIILGILVLLYLSDGPAQASWLTSEECDWLKRTLAEENRHKQEREMFTLTGALASGRVWLLSLLYFVLMLSFYGVTLWLPQVLKSFSGLRDTMVGVIAAIPYFTAAIAMVWVSASSDRRQERRWHIALPAFVGAVGLVSTAYVHSPILALVSLCLATFGIWGSLGPFWTLPTAFLSGTAAAGGIALINSVGNLGGFLGPYAVGLVKTATHSFTGGLILLAASLVAGGLLVLLFPHASEHLPIPNAATTQLLSTTRGTLS